VGGKYTDIILAEEMLHIYESYNYNTYHRTTYNCQQKVVTIKLIYFIIHGERAVIMHCKCFIRYFFLHFIAVLATTGISTLSCAKGNTIFMILTSLLFVYEIDALLITKGD
jgi:hypothetical protein